MWPDLGAKLCSECVCWSAVLLLLCVCTLEMHYLSAPTVGGRKTLSECPPWKISTCLHCRRGWHKVSLLLRWDTSLLGMLDFKACARPSLMGNLQRDILAKAIIALWSRPWGHAGLWAKFSYDLDVFEWRYPPSAVCCSKALCEIECKNASIETGDSMSRTY